MPKNLGVNIDELILSQPDSGEQGLQIAEMLIKSGAIDIIVVDSVAALVPQAELDGEMGDAQVGLQARMMSKAMRKLSGVMNRSECTAIFINQLREKVGVMFGNPETTTGRPCAEVLRQRASGYPPQRGHQERHGDHRQQGQCQGRQEQGGSSFQDRKH